MAGQSIRVSVPSLWSEKCATCLHQTIQTCTCKASPPGHQTDNVLRRYVGDGTEQGGTRESLIPDNISSRVVRFCGQQGEVSIGTSPGDSLPWFHGGLQGDEDQAVRREGNTNFNSLQEGQGEGIHISETISQINWQDDSNPPCNLPSPVMVQRASVSEEPDIPEVPVLQDHHDTESGGPSGAGLVVNQEEFNGWEECIDTGT